MKNKSWVTIILAMLIVTISLAFAEVNINAEPMNKVKQFVCDTIGCDWQFLSVTGGKLSATEVQKGDTISVDLNTKFTTTGTQFKYEVFFCDNSYTKLGTYQITKSYTYNYKAGDWVTFNVRGLDTGQVPDYVCGKYIRVCAKHYQNVNGTWKQDGGIGTTSNQFFMKCTDFSGCQVESQGIVCYVDDNLWEKIKGKDCSIYYTKYKTCSNGCDKTTNTCNAPVTPPPITPPIEIVSNETIADNNGTITLPVINNTGNNTGGGISPPVEEETINILGYDIDKGDFKLAMIIFVVILFGLIIWGVVRK